MLIVASAVTAAILFNDDATAEAGARPDIDVVATQESEQDSVLAEVPDVQGVDEETESKGIDPSGTALAPDEEEKDDEGLSEEGEEIGAPDTADSNAIAKEDAIRDEIASQPPRVKDAKVDPPPRRIKPPTRPSRSVVEEKKDEEKEKEKEKEEPRRVKEPVKRPTMEKWAPATPEQRRENVREDKW